MKIFLEEVSFFVLMCYGFILFHFREGCKCLWRKAGDESTENVKVLEGRVKEENDSLGEGSEGIMNSEKKIKAL